MVILAQTSGGRGYAAEIRLPNGRVAGEGRADSKSRALYIACLDAIGNGYTHAALNSATMLSMKDENEVRNAARSRMRNPIRVTHNQLVAGGVLLGGVALLYYLFKPAAAATKAAPGTPGNPLPAGAAL